MAPAKRTTVPMKREDVMQGYWSVAVDEKRPSLAVDDAVFVGVRVKTGGSRVGGPELCV